MDIYDSIIQAKKLLKLNNNELGSIINKSGDTLRKALNRKSLGDLELLVLTHGIIDIANESGLSNKSEIILLTDNLKGIKSENAKNLNKVLTLDSMEEPTPEVYKPEGKLIEPDNYPKKTVHVIPIKGRGGLENAFFDEVKFEDLEKETLTIKEPSSNGSKWFKIEVEGVSMDDGSKRILFIW